MMCKLNDREVEVTKIQGEIGEGAYAVSANYVDGDCEELNDYELDKLSDKYAAELYDEYYQDQICASEAYYEGDR